MGRDRWASALLVWEWRGVQLQAEISRCRYFCRAHGREVLAWCELADISGGQACGGGIVQIRRCGEGGVRAARGCAVQAGPGGN